MAEWLSKCGHDIRVVTAPPFYPQWRTHPSYPNWRYSRERDHGFQIFRCPIWIPSQPSGFKRLLHLVSFAISSLPCLLANAAWKPDVLWVVEPTFFIFPAALLAGQLTGARTWAHVQDLEIDAAFDFGMLPSGLRRLVVSIEKFLLARFDRVSTISENMLIRVHGKGVSPTRALLFPNWIDTQSVYPLPYPSSIRAELGIAPERIVCLYSGSMAAKQGFEVLIDAIERLSDRSDLHFVFCGEGPSRALLNQRLGARPNVHIIPLQPVDHLNDLLNAADIHLLPQRPDAADLMMPAKLLGMFASGRPVIATAESGTQLAQVVAGCGLVVRPNDCVAMSSAIAKLAGAPDLRHELGANARSFAERNMSSTLILPRFENQLLSLFSEDPSTTGAPVRVGNQR